MLCLIDPEWQWPTILWKSSERRSQHYKIKRSGYEVVNHTPLYPLTNRMRRKQKHGQWLHIFGQYTARINKGRAPWKNTDTSYGMGRSSSVGSEKLTTLNCDPTLGVCRGCLQRENARVRSFTVGFPTSTFPLGFPLKLNRHPWDISNVSWPWRDKSQKGSFGKHFKSWFHFRLERKASVSNGGTNKFFNTGIVENLPPS